MVKAQECKVALDLVHVWSYKGGISPFGKPRSNGGASLSGVVVRPGETVKCNPGEFCFRVSQIALHAGKGNGDVRIFVKVDDKEILLGTLSDDKYPHYITDLSFEEFELLHTSETRNISIIGFKYSKLGRKYHFLFFLYCIFTKRNKVLIFVP